jgi:hypothetical protein
MLIRHPSATTILRTSSQLTKENLATDGFYGSPHSAFRIAFMAIANRDDWRLLELRGSLCAVVHLRFRSHGGTFEAEALNAKVYKIC